ncbi:universal stress protein [Pararhizobium sp. IMCC21322]|uniref:universal stress protein n=1 Tax=Pararhizobium sp. IMCC21322 TaxID=3067903 RepID=UPI002741441D|nr:universal stress protein [Pararhizobium sp. IMCC21322]
MYKNILVPIALDHERDTESALDLAHKLLENGGKITALHVLEHVAGYTQQYLPKDQLAKRHIEAEANLVKEIEGQKQIEPVVITGHSGRSIVDYAESNGVDCIIIASHRPGLQDYFLGSTAARVVRHAHCAVHVIR